MSDENRQPNKPNPERKTPSIGGNIALYLLVLCVGSILLISLMPESSQIELGYTDLIKLVEKGGPGKKSQGLHRGPRSGVRQRETRSLFQVGQTGHRNPRNHRRRGPPGDSA